MAGLYHMIFIFNSKFATFELVGPL